MGERPKNAYEQAADLFEPAAATLLKNPNAAAARPMEAGALASIAISLRRLADVFEHEAHVKADRDRAATSGWRWGDPVDEKRKD